jgi:hypothetical protein
MIRAGHPISMRRGSMRWLVVLAALALGACASDLEPGPAELKARWDAQNVYPKDYKNDLLAFLRTYLNHPEHVRDAAVAPPQLKKAGPGDRYVACVRYNARKSDGHYAGSKDGAAIYVSGRLDSFIDQKQRVKELCNGAAFAPFPALEKLTR